jgi:hypothetical protein
VNALYANTTLNKLVAIGDSALMNNGIGSTQSDQGWRNAAVGSKALFSNTIGSNNTAVGFEALRLNTNGNYNGAFGVQALNANTTGASNTAVGTLTLYNNSTGSYNLAVGTGGMATNTTGAYNTAMGYFADVSSTGLVNATAIGANAVVDASNKVRVGDNSVTSIGGKVGWTTFPSDGRYKKNIKEDVQGLKFINSLRPITYTIDMDGLNNYFDKNKKHDEAYERMKKEKKPAEDEAAKVVYNGFIAQEVEAAAKKLNYNFSGVDKPKTDDGLYGIRYGDFVVPLVKAVQELSKTNDEKEATIDELKKQNETQQQQIDDLKAIVQQIQQSLNNCNPCVANSSTQQGGTIVLTSGASLQQNIPNPFNHTTTINYSLPQQFSSAKIVVTDKAGKILKEANLSGGGKGSLTVDASMLSSGAYQYSLYVDGRLIGTKQMEHIR